MAIQFGALQREEDGTFDIPLGLRLSQSQSMIGIIADSCAVTT